MVAGTLPCEHGSVEGEVLSQVRPTAADYDSVGRLVKHLVDLVGSVVRSAGFDSFTVSVEGSVAKDTWLKGEVDVDVFVWFSRDVCKRSIEVFVEKVAPLFASRGFLVELRHAQHPYLRVLVEGFWVEVVPGCLYTGGRPLTAVDRTRLHTRYVVSSLSPPQRDEVRLLKSFMKGVGVYGAELAVGGFSGYAAELLVVKYGCFRRVVCSAAGWRPPVILYVEDGLRDAVKRLMGKYPSSLVFMPDPVDPSRNVAASVTPRSLGVFVLASRMYCRSPSIKFFHVHGCRASDSVYSSYLGERIENMVLVELVFKERVAPDNMWGMAERARKVASGLLKSHGFIVVNSSTFCDPSSLRCAMLVELQERVRRGLQAREGPFAWDAVQADRFISKYLELEAVGPWIDHDGRLRVLVKPPYTSADELLSAKLAQGLPRSLKNRLDSVLVHTGLNAIDAARRLSRQWFRENIVLKPCWIG